MERQPAPLALLAPFALFALLAVSPVLAATATGTAAPAKPVAKARTAKPAPAKAGKAAPAKPATGGSELTILYGDDHAFGIVPPAGWTVDDTSGLGSRIRVVLYPKGQTWKSATTVMYVNPLHQKAGKPRPLRDMIRQDVESFMRQSPRGTVAEEEALTTAKKLTAEVRSFSTDGREPTEVVAYVPEADLVMLIVLQSRNAADFKRALPAFRALVSSYQFVAGGIQTPR